METAIFSKQLADTTLIKNNDIEIIETGIGVVNTTYRLLKKLSNSSFDLVIQAGIGGAFKKETGLGDVLMIGQDTFGDLGMEEKENFQTVFQAGFASADEHPFSDGWLKNNNDFLKRISLPVVKAVTVNKVTDDLLQQQQLRLAFNPDVESMEGAALHYVCLLEKIPFIQIRSISNYVGERNKANWKLKESLANLNKVLSEIVVELTTSG